MNIKAQIQSLIATHISDEKEAANITKSITDMVANEIRQYTSVTIVQGDPDILTDTYADRMNQGYNDAVIQISTAFAS